MAYVQNLLDNADASAGTTLILSGSKTVTEGNDIVIALVEQNIAATISVADNLGNAYTGYEFHPGGTMKLRVFRSHAITGGTLTTITLTWNVNTGARAAISAEYDALDAIVIGTDENDATSTAPQGITPTGEGTHLFCVATASAVTGSTGGTFTPPSGYSGRSDGNATSVRVILADAEGNLSGNKIGAFASSTFWVVGTMAMAAAVAPPALTAAYSFDGVTVR